jgi:REP element-mobilizing transposase RayT
MPRTLGYHYVRSAYGLWLPGEDRGHWSEAWDQQIGFIEPHTLHGGDPIRKRMAEERMAHPPVRWTTEIQSIITASFAKCAEASPWKVAAYCIEETHLHGLLTYSPTNIDNTAKWIGQQMTKAVHQQTTHTGPVFCKGRWLQFVFEDSHWANLLRYIESHNVRRGLPARPYDFVRAEDRG